MLNNLDSHMIGIGKVPLHTLLPLAGKHGYQTIQFPPDEITTEDQEDLERELPLVTGVIDSVSVIRTMKELGYKGPVTVEPLNLPLPA